MNRILVWQTMKSDSNVFSIGPTYYMDGDYTPVGLRLYAEQAPCEGVAQFEIYDDGESIFEDVSNTTYYTTGGVKKVATPVTRVVLQDGDNSDEMADLFAPNRVIDEGSWISCRILSDGGGKNFTVQLELEPFEDD